jgi:two-component system, NtrC family, sensor kinase
VRISVQDHGTGIPADQLSRVTDPFFSTKPGGKGTGLGLSVSLGLMGAHGGALNIESSAGAFTRVLLDLPAGGSHAG